MVASITALANCIGIATQQRLCTGLAACAGPDAALTYGRPRTSSQGITSKAHGAGTRRVDGLRRRRLAARAHPQRPDGPHARVPDGLDDVAPGLVRCPLGPRRPA